MDLNRENKAFSDSRGEFHFSACDRKVKQVAEIAEPMTEVIELIGKSDHISIVELNPGRLDRQFLAPFANVN